MQVSNPGDPCKILCTSLLSASWHQDVRIPTQAVNAKGQSRDKPESRSSKGVGSQVPGQVDTQGQSLSQVSGSESEGEDQIKLRSKPRVQEQGMDVAGTLNIHSCLGTPWNVR